VTVAKKLTLLQKTRITRARIKEAEVAARATLTPQERQVLDVGASASTTRPTSARVRVLGQKYAHEEFE